MAPSQLHIRVLASPRMSSRVDTCIPATDSPVCGVQRRGDACVQTSATNPVLAKGNGAHPNHRNIILFFAYYWIGGNDCKKSLFSAAFIQQNANKFLDHDWVDIGLLKDYYTQTSLNPASSAPATRSITVPDAVHVKIEARPLFAVKVEPHEIIEIPCKRQFKRLMDFVYINSKESLDVFSGFVYRLNIDKITCSCSFHLTSEPRRKVDENVADEIQLSLESGILTNANNDLSHRMARNSQRQTATTRKSRESRAAVDQSRDIQLQIDAEAEKRRASTALTKDFKAQLKAAKGTSGKRGKAKAKAVILSASSSGRVKMTQSRMGELFDSCGSCGC
ncbi:hypothetical protein C8R45DRAFT_1083775 [Mycena sanguinolenta]|nr:hypothetical protein C8R45DRAFT_1083775 [Mycena sanguinolenta]